MKTHTIRTAIVVLLFTVLVIGCKKTSDTVTVFCYMTTVATTSTSGTLTSDAVFYNSSNKVTTVTSVTGTSVSTNTYSYDSKGNIITLVITGTGITSTLTYTYTYDVNNNLTQRDITTGTTLTSRTTYVYNATSQLTSVSTVSYSGTPPVPSTPSVTTYIYPNTTTKNWSKVTFASGSTSLYEYDNKTNPYKKIFFTSREPDNNITKEIFTSSGTTPTTTTYTYTYQYNSNGYPTSRVTTTSGTSTSSTTTFTYQCK